LKFKVRPGREDDFLAPTGNDPDKPSGSAGEAADSEPF
jgi:hypothetical protein